MDFLSIFLSFSIAACSKNALKTSVSLTAYKHTENGVGSYRVTLEDGASAGAGFLAPGGGGGGDTCCLLIPLVWKPGMKATVIMKTIKDDKDISVEQTVLVPQYYQEDVGRFVVHFLHDGSYKVFVTKYSLGHRKYPLSGKQAERRPGIPLEIIWE